MSGDGLRSLPGLRMLADHGLAMQAVLDLALLPSWATDPLVAAGVSPDRYSRMVMLGQAGTRLWDTMEAAGFDSPDRFDDFSMELARSFAEDYLETQNWVAVYPGTALLPLGRLAELAGWGSPSPLGLTIHGSFGLWIAHRIVLLVDVAIPLSVEKPFPHPCDTCLDKPCVTACPVGAVDAVTGFDVNRCSTFRVREDSRCALRCLAREACPVGKEHRYRPQQMAHHYGSGLASTRAYLEP